MSKCLDSIASQDFDLSKVEILVIDGWSTDNTRQIASEYGARILDNPMVQQEFAKHIGILNSTGKYLVFLDSDEILFSKTFLRNNLEIFEKNSNVKFIVFSGYITPNDSGLINTYINSLGDPFAFFIYSDDKNYLNFYRLVKKKYSKYDMGNFVILDKNRVKKKGMLVDISASNCVDKESLYHILGEKINSPEFIPKVFYIYLSSDYDIAVVKDQPVIHYSSETFMRFLSKLRWRVMVNVHYKSIPGTGFSNREFFLTIPKRLKKYLFLPYSFSVILPLLDGIILAFKNKNIVFLLHPFLSLYTSLSILWNYVLKLFGVKPNLPAYGKDDLNKSIIK